MNLTATEYRNSAERFPEFRKKILLRSTVFILISLVFAVIIFFYSGDEDFAGSITVPIIYLLFILGILVFSIMRVIKQQEAIYLSYKLTITKDGIYREQSNLPAVTINLKDITEINENVSGHIIIKGSDARKMIAISSFLENLEQARNQLHNLHPFSESKSQNLFQRYPLLLTFVLLGAMACVFIASNKLLVALGGLICLSTLAWSFYKVRTAPIMDKKLSRLSWWSVIVFISIAATVYFKLFGIN